MILAFYTERGAFVEVRRALGCRLLGGGVWEVGAYSEVENTYVHHLHTFLHTGSGIYNPLQHARIVSRPHILYNISTTLYNTLQHSTVYSSTRRRRQQRAVERELGRE